jgi:hypothetical protein
LGNRIANGLHGLWVVLSSALVGAVYFWYLKSEPFPPDIVRLVPVAWLAGSILGGVVAARGLRSHSNRAAAALALALGVLSAAFAFVFTMAALMGD